MGGVFSSPAVSLIPEGVIVGREEIWLRSGVAVEEAEEVGMFDSVIFRSFLYLISSQAN